MWVNEIREKLMQKKSSDVQVIVLLVPGKNGKAQLYRELKRFTFEQLPVVSQVVLTGTIREGRNLRQIITKILTQICAKTGGIPWIMDSLPLFDQRTMIVGLDSFEQPEMPSVLGFVATYNRSATKYWAKSVVQEQVGEEVCLQMTTLMVKALQNFKASNGKFPQRVIVFRHGISPAETFQMTKMEIEMIY